MSIGSVAKTFAQMAITALFDAIRSSLSIKPKKPKAVPMTHKGVEHVQAQIRSATTGVNRMPPPRKKR